MVLISHKHKFIFVKDTSVAGTSIEAYLGQFCCENTYNFTGEKTQEEHISDVGILGSRNHVKGNKMKTWHNHLSCKEIKDLLKKEGRKFSDYKIVGVVRNPWNKVLTKYIKNFKKPDKKKFNKYVKEVYKHKICNNHKYYIKDKCTVKYVIRFTHLEEDIRKFVVENGIAPSFNISELPNHRSDKGIIDPQVKKQILANYRDFYGEESVEIIGRRWEYYVRDFNLEF